MLILCEREILLAGYSEDEANRVKVGTASHNIGSNARRRERRFWTSLKDNTVEGLNL